VGYVIAAYTLVIGTIAGYGLWLRARRRKLMQDAEGDGSPHPNEPGAG
jgi:hypothetical protein